MTTVECFQDAYMLYDVLQKQLELACCEHGAALEKVVLARTFEMN